ncbi:MAG: methionine--tRNA ligase [Gammaproteobacteria bacterium]|nr:methionine--tRNA ligase [Gammaproteobacteria bacterium]
MSKSGLFMRRILVTSALPYANGSVHLGHLLEHIQTDIWVRFQRMRGHQCIYVCADDTHGTATMLLAERDGVSEEELIKRLHAEHIADFERFHISHDNYYSTHSDENQYYSNLIYTRLRDRGFIYTDNVEQLFDPERKMFLADRNVRGECPRCGAENQPGDNCDSCGATYDARELKNPVSAISNSTPILRNSEHYFVDLPKFTEFLREYIHNGSQQPEIANKLTEWIDGGLRGWDISRDAPYFGFPIPDTVDKFFYVWMDAPIGYLASFKNWCTKNGVDFDEFWRPDSDCEVHHFIGKDIINFHCLFWPSVLHHSDFRTPLKVHVHGMLTMDSEKMSKSRGTFVLAQTYLDFFDPDLLRYYLGARLGPNSGDIDFGREDFVSRVNSDLVGKLVNIAARSEGFLAKNFDNKLASELAEPELWQEFVDESDRIAAWYEEGDTRRVVRRVMELADKCNQYLANKAPWQLIKDDGRRDEVQGICSMGINLYRVLIGFLKPIVPSLTDRSEEFLNAGPMTWDNLTQPLLSHRLSKFGRLLNRIELKTFNNMIEAGAEEATPKETEVTDSDPSEIQIDDFLKVDLRVARIVEADVVDGADKLLRLRLDVGDHERTVLSGIRSAYKPDELVGRSTVVVANLQPRKMKFGVSEGMVLAAGPGGSDIFLLAPDDGAQPGMRVT